MCKARMLEGENPSQRIKGLPINVNVAVVYDAVVSFVGIRFETIVLSLREMRIGEVFDMKYSRRAIGVSCVERYNKTRWKQEELFGPRRLLLQVV